MVTATPINLHSILFNNHAESDMEECAWVISSDNTIGVIMAGYLAGTAVA